MHGGGVEVVGDGVALVLIIGVVVVVVGGVHGVEHSVEFLDL